MKIVLTEVRTGAWEINLVPESRDDLKKEMSAGRVAQILASISHDLLKRYVDTVESVSPNTGVLGAMPHTPAPSGVVGMITPDDLKKSQG